MIVWSTLEASCPACATRLRLREVGSGFALGQDSDLLVRMRGKHVVQAEIHTCAKCHFSGYAADFLRTLPDADAERFLHEISPSLLPLVPPPNATEVPYASTPLPDVQYYWAYQTARALRSSPLEQAERLVRAYWCLRMPPSSSLEPMYHRTVRKLYLKSAIQKIRLGLGPFVAPHWTYLLAELCRRNGNFRLAAGYFRQFLSEQGAPYLYQAATRLLRLCSERVSTELGMEEVLYNQAQDLKGTKERE
jgi:hypothetical protein